MVSGNGQSNHFRLWFSYHIVITRNSAPKLQLLQLWPRKSFCSYSQTTSEWSVTEVVPTSDRYSTYNYWHKKYCSSEDVCHDLALISIRPKCCENIKKAKVSILMSVTTIGPNAFMDCIKLATITLPESIKKLMTMLSTTVSIWNQFVLRISAFMIWGIRFSQNVMNWKIFTAIRKWYLIVLGHLKAMGVASFLGINVNDRMFWETYIKLNNKNRWICLMIKLYICRWRWNM